MLLLLYPVLIVITYLFGNLASNLLNKNEERKSDYVSFAVDLVSGYSLYLLLVHLVNFIFKNLLISSLLIAVIFVAVIVINKNKISKIILNKFDILAIIFSFIIAGLMSFKDFLYGNPDNFHIALTASISENNIYPPIFPSTYDMSMSSYHYGVDLIGAIFMKLFQLSAWDAQTLQIFFDVSFCMLSLYAVILFFTKKSSVSFWATIVATFYTSINSLDFFFREFANFFGTDLMLTSRLWLIASWTSVSHLTSQLRLPSQNSAFFFAFILVIVLAKTIYEKKNYYPTIIACAFGVYFTFPAFFYPMLAALILCFIYELFINARGSGLKALGKLPRALSPQPSAFIVFLCLLALVLGKILTFTGSHTDTGGIKALIFAPSPYWIHWGKAYLNYFYDSFYLQSLPYAFDYAHPAYHPKIHILSSITFREFGFDALVALAIVIYQIKNKKVNFSILLFLSAIISICVPLLIQFIPRPIETTRFLHLTKIFLVVFNCIHVPYFFDLFIASIQEIKSAQVLAKITKLLCLTLLVIMLVPGVISVIPKDEFVITGPNGVPIKLRPVLRTMQKIHKTGDVCLDDIAFKHGHNVTEIAGFYGPGGQMYKSDDISRKSALLSLNPMILKDLKINYIFMGPQDQITMEAAYRLAHREVFEKALEMNVNNEFYTLYRFNQDKLMLDTAAEENLRSEYLWILGCEIADKFEVMRDPNGQIISSNSHEEIIKMKAMAKSKLATINPVCGFWLKEQIVLTSMLGK